MEVSRQGMDGAKVSRILKAVDLFCGAGGTSQGAEQSGAAKVICAVNHWQRAVDTHSANFPHAQHINSRLDQVNPSECGKFDLLFASPECTHHSRARGGKPTSDQQRSGAWDLMRWVEYHRPSYSKFHNDSAVRTRWPWLHAHQHVEGPYCFVLTNVRRLLRPILYTGAQGLFDVVPSTADEVSRQLKHNEFVSMGEVTRA